MTLGDRLDDRQPQPAASRAAGRASSPEPLRRLPVLVRFETSATIGQTEPDRGGIGISDKAYGTSRRQIAQRVVDEVAQRRHGQRGRHSRYRLTTASSHDKDRKSVVQGKSVSVRVDLGGRRIIKKKK